jgi:leucyl-tRNA synthetase
MIQEETVMVIVQVNGKKRGEIKIKDQKSKIKDEVEKLALEDERVKIYLAGKSVKKTIFVSGKLVNFVAD